MLEKAVCRCHKIISTFLPFHSHVIQITYLHTLATTDQGFNINYDPIRNGCSVTGSGYSRPSLIRFMQENFFFSNITSNGNKPKSKFENFVCLFVLFCFAFSFRAGEITPPISPQACGFISEIGWGTMFPDKMKASHRISLHYLCVNGVCLRRLVELFRVTINFPKQVKFPSHANNEYSN